MKRAGVTARYSLWFRHGLFVLILLCLGACGDEVLYQDLTQREANQLVTALRQSGIHAKRIPDVEGLFHVAVDDSNFSEAIRILEQRGLPQLRFKNMGDVFASDGMLSTPVEERARLAFALSQELSASLTAIEGINDARVHITLSEDRPLSENDREAAASVLVSHTPDLDVEAIMPDIKLLVTKAVPDLNYRNVSVATIPVKQWDVSRGPAFHFNEFLGVRFVENDAEKFGGLLAALLVGWILTIALLVFVIWSFVVPKKLNENRSVWPSLSGNLAGLTKLSQRKSSTE